ncbi:MAG: hypothetical protein K2Y71_18900 [Xanthobacteraceae bacterium]|nr:hypothetical protein [Xanthobacteraceae bacterium]
MRRISSRNTFFLKRIVPIIMFGFLVFVFWHLLVRGQDPGPPMWFIVLMLPFSFVIAYGALKHTVFDLVDVVFDEGESLLVRNKNREERISLSDIEVASYMLFGARVILTLKRPSTFGTEIVFLPLQEPFPFVKNAAIKRLIQKINERRIAQVGAAPGI